MASETVCYLDPLVDDWFNHSSYDMMEFDDDSFVCQDFAFMGDDQLATPQEAIRPVPTPNDVCFKACSHQGTKKWRLAIQNFSGNPKDFPNWCQNIFDQIMQELAQHNTRFFVSVDDQGNPCRHIKDGQWVLATPLDVFKRTKERFKEDRKERSRPDGERKPRGRPCKAPASPTFSQSSSVSSQSPQIEDAVARFHETLTDLCNHGLNLERQLRDHPPSSNIDFLLELRSKLNSLQDIVWKQIEFQQAASGSRQDNVQGSFDSYLGVDNTPSPMPVVHYSPHNPFDDRYRNISSCIKGVPVTAPSKPDINESSKLVMATKRDDTSQKTSSEKDEVTAKQSNRSRSHTYPDATLSARPPPHPSSPQVFKSQNVDKDTVTKNRIPSKEQDANVTVPKSTSSARATADSPEAMLSVLIAEMEFGECSVQVVVTTLEIDTWLAFYAALTADQFGRIVASVPVDSDRPRVAELLAKHVVRFTCDHVAKAMSATTFRVCMAQRLHPFCSVAATHLVDKIKNELEEVDMTLLTSLLSKKLQVK